MEALSEKLLLTPCPEAPACGQMLRAFERDAVGQTSRRTSAGRVASVTFLFVGALLCALLFWLLTVLLEPRNPVQAAPQTPVTQEQNDANISNDLG